MLEIPEASVIARQLRKLLTDAQVRAVVANATPHKFAWFHGDPTAYSALLNGRRLTDAQARGGQVEVRFDQDVRLVLCDGISVRYGIPGDTPPKTHQLYLTFDSGAALYCTVQMYGGMYAFRAGELDNPYYRAACEKPSPLTDAFTEPYFLRLFDQSDPKWSLKAFLATEQRIPGLGNGVLQDILFFAGLHPKRKLGTLAREDAARLYRSVTDTLRTMEKQGGRDVETDLFGQAGGYATRCSRLTAGLSCEVCGTPIAKESYMGGAVYYCPTCQPLQKEHAR